MLSKLHWVVTFILASKIMRHLHDHVSTILLHIMDVSCVLNCMSKDDMKGDLRGLHLNEENLLIDED